MNGPIEPSAGMRQAAHWMRELYVAMVSEGFTEAEALHVVGVAVATAVNKEDSE